MREQLGDRLPLFTESEVALLEEAETDFYGMNYYTSQFARHRGEPASDTDFVGNLDELQQDKQGTPVGEESGLHWLRSCPDFFRKHLTRVYNLYGKPIYITENGCPCPGEDKMTCDEAVNDPYRIKYFNSHLDAICKSIVDDGAVIKGYFAWALLDNLGELLPISQVFVANRFTEWSDGYGPRFGVTFTDYKTLKRTPKQSALLLRKMVTDRQGLSVTTS